MIVAQLDQQEIARYSRHLVLPEVGMEGQTRLKEASVLLVGAGGLGSPLGMYLAAAGLGRIGLVDFDSVDHSNLQRQILYGTSDVGRPKLQAASERLADLNPNVVLETHEVRLHRDNALELLAPYELIIDGTDNFATRYLVNDACVLLGKPNVYGSILRFEGQASVFWAERGPCYRCLFPHPPPPGAVPSCAEGGVLGVLPGIIGSIQAMEAIKLILGQGDSLVGRLLIFDALGMNFRELKLRKAPECPVCGENPTITELLDYDEICGMPDPADHENPGQHPRENESEMSGHEMTVTDLKARIDADDAPVMLDVREPQEVSICNIEGSVNIPLMQVPDRLSELDKDKEIVVYCRTGPRSAQAVLFLHAQGFGSAINLTGGIHAWAEQIDPSMPRY